MFFVAILRHAFRLPPRLSMTAIRPPASQALPDADPWQAAARAHSPHPDPLPARGEREPSDREAGEGRVRETRAETTIVPARQHPLALKQYLWIIGAIAVLFFALEWLGPVLTPFLVGAKIGRAHV